MEDRIIGLIIFLISSLLPFIIFCFIIPKTRVKSWVDEYIRDVVAGDSLKEQDGNLEKITTGTIVNVITFTIASSNDYSRPEDIAGYFRHAILNSPDSENCKAYLKKHYGIMLDGKLSTYDITCISCLVYTKKNQHEQLSRLGMDLPTLGMLGFYLHRGTLEPEITTKLK